MFGVRPDWATGAYINRACVPNGVGRAIAPRSALGLPGSHRSGVRKCDGFERRRKLSAAGALRDQERTRTRRRVSLAAVDEGILLLTTFASPDPSESDRAEGTPGRP